MNIHSFLTGIGFALLFCIFSVLIFTNQQPTTPPQQTQPQWFELAYAQIGDYAGQQALGFEIRAPKNHNAKSVLVEMYEDKPIQEIVILEGPWIGAQNMDKLSVRIEAGSKIYGWSVNEKNYAQLAPATNPRMIILPSGAWPKKFDIETQTTQKDCILYMGLQKNISLREDGAVVEGGVAPQIIEQKEHIRDYQFSPIKDMNRTIFVIRTTVDEIRDYEKFAKDALAFSEEFCQTPVMKKEIEYKQEFEVVETHARKQNPWIRISIYSQNEILRMWTKQLQSEGGIIEGVKEVVDDSQQIFRVQIWPNYTQEQQIRYYSAVFDSQGNIYEKTQLGEMVMPAMSEQQKRGFVSSFALTQWPQTKTGIIEVQDQYARVYARAFVSLPRYRITNIHANGIRRDFLILKDLRPIEDRFANVRRVGDDEWTKVALREGVFSVGSEWNDGVNKLEVNIGKDVVSCAWIDNEENSLEKILKGVLVALGVFIFIYFVGNAQKQTKYLIVIEETSARRRQEINIGKERLVEIVNEPLHIAQIIKKIETIYAPKNMMLSPQSVRDSLEKIASMKKIRNYREYYAPIKKYSQEQLVKFVIETYLRDRLLERGISVKQKYKWGIVDSKNRVWAIYANKGDEKIWRGNIPDFVVFENKKQVFEFRQMCARVETKQTSRFSIALQLGKMRLMSINDIREFVKYD